MTIPTDVIQKFRDYLSSHGMLFTQERNRILQAIYSREDHFSADDMLFHMHEQGLKVSRATLYRNLKQMTQAGLLVEADFGHGHIHYERAIGVTPHEHLVCQLCETVSEVSSPQVAQAVQQIVQGQGFTLNHYQLKIFGICSVCTQKALDKSCSS